MYKVKIFNNIAASGLERLDSNKYQIIDDLSKSTSIVLRSHKLTEDNIPLSINAIGRAGAGVNNIPVDAMSDRGVPVFNAPGANANAVKELTIASLLIAARNICTARDYVRSLDPQKIDIKKSVEAGSKPTTFIPSASAVLATLTPIDPRPTTPKVRPGSSIPANCFFPASTDFFISIFCGSSERT